jgi:hypothetical protein
MTLQGIAQLVIQVARLPDHVRWELHVSDRAYP